jgi:hypothetical protein
MNKLTHIDEILVHTSWKHWDTYNEMKHTHGVCSRDDRDIHTYTYNEWDAFRDVMNADHLPKTYLLYDLLKLYVFQYSLYI